MKAPAFRPAIWNPFSSAFTPSGRARISAAIPGLGLSIARQIIEGAGGRIYAENRSPDNSQGSGARLIVELPLAQQHV